MKLFKKSKTFLLAIIAITFLLIRCDPAEYFGDSSSSSSCADCKKTYLTTPWDQGNLGGISGADAKCMTDANYPGSGTYKAMIVDGVNRVASVSANTGNGQVDWVLQPNTKYYLSDGTTHIMTTDSNGIFVFGTWNTTISPNRWSGLMADWRTDTANYCQGWTTSNHAISGSIGHYAAVDSEAIRYATPQACSSQYKLLCVEQ